MNANAKLHAAVDPMSRGWPKLAFGLVLSGFMSLVVSGIASGTAFGLPQILNNPSAYLGVWMRAYLGSWAVAFPLATVAAPVVRRFVLALVVKAPRTSGDGGRSS